MSDPRRYDLAGAPIDAVKIGDAVRWCLDRGRSGKRTRVAGLNAALLVMASQDSPFLETLRGFDLVLPDGFWAAAGASLVNRSRIPHSNTVPFVRALLAEMAEDRPNVFLLGARPEVVAKAARLLPELHSGVRVTGYRDGYFRPDEEDGLVAEINAAVPDVLLVGMSSPLKENFVLRHWARLEVTVSVGVGGLFDIWAGTTREAPEWMRNAGFEWLFRLFQEPRRMLPRYTTTNFEFARLIVRELVRGGPRR